MTGRSLKWEKQAWSKTKGRDGECGTWQNLPIYKGILKNYKHSTSQRSPSLLPVEILLQVAILQLLDSVDSASKENRIRLVKKYWIFAKWHGHAVHWRQIHHWKRQWSLWESLPSWSAHVCHVRAKFHCSYPAAPPLSLRRQPKGTKRGFLSRLTLRKDDTNELIYKTDSQT